MAAGITGGATATATVFLEDDLHADADLDAVLDLYHPADIVLKGLAGAGVTDLGTNVKSYRSQGSIQNGDGVGTATTTFQATSLRLNFDSTKTYLMSTVGQANRWTKLGTKIQGAAGRPSGRNGCILDFGAATTLRGNMQFYASTLRNAAAGAINLQPGAAGLTTEIVGCLIETTSGAGSISVGTSTTLLQLIYNVEFVLGGTGTISQINATEIEKIWIVVTGSNNYAIQTGAAFAIKDPVFIGTPLIAYVTYTGSNEAHLINPTWGGNAIKVNVAVSYFNEWFPLNTLSGDTLTGAIVPNVPVRITDDTLGTVIFDGLTNSKGGITFNNDPSGAARNVFANAVNVMRHLGDPAVAQELGPWTVEVNLAGPDQIAGYAAYSFKTGWKHTDLPSTFGKQYEPMVIPIRMVAPPAPAIPDPILVDDVPVAADGEIRYQVAIPGGTA